VVLHCLRPTLRQGSRVLPAVLWILSVLSAAHAQTSSAPSQFNSAPGITEPLASTNEVRLISLRECIDLALARNLGVQIARLGPDIARYELKAYYGTYDPTLTLAAGRDFVDQPSNFDPKKLGTARFDQEYEQRLDTVGPSIGGRLPF